MEVGKHVSGSERFAGRCLSSGLEVESFKDDEGGWRDCDQKRGAHVLPDTMVEMPRNASVSQNYGKMKRRVAMN